MKKLFSLLLAIVMLLSCVPIAFAADNSRAFLFELSVDGKDEKEAQPGDIITVVFTLNRTDSDTDYEMYAMQNEIRYDSAFFKLVEGSAMLSDGISTTEIGLRDSFREFYMNFVSLSGGETWKANRLVGSFQLEVIGTSGVSKITNQDYLVSTADGKDIYAAECQNVTVILSTECTVNFQTNGGTEIPSIKGQYGETIARPQDPVREGYHLVGWYTDIDMQIPWDFDVDTLQGNLTLYAKWESGDPIREEPEEDNGGHAGIWLILGLGLLTVLALLLFLLLGKKTVKFETRCKMKIKDQKVKKGSLVERPEQPKRLNRTFGGWYFDEECTERWDFETDTVEDNMTLYAKWL
ncbi:MAG: InlB B-repeat-containing protein [Oscillospiraceae bacterium]|nr:InlB B-repeat-containing protein [Oscillospiraceae bacterium]